MNSINVQQIVASILVSILTVLVIFASWRYTQAIFGALILYVLLKPAYCKLSKKLNKKFAAGLVILASIIIIVGPLIFMTSLIIGEVRELTLNANQITDVLEHIELPFDLNIQSELLELAKNSGKFIQNSLIEVFGNISDLILNIFIMYFILYYMLINQHRMKQFAISLIPFSEKNAKKLAQEFSDFTQGTIIVSGIVALVQAVLLTISFLLIGVPGAFVWGFIAFIFSFIPVVGPAIIWIPTAILLFVNGNTQGAITLLIAGAIISNIDNIIRPYLNERISNTHPVVSFLGIFIGIPLFGILGIIIGPMLIIYLFLTIRMYKEEYL